MLDHCRPLQPPSDIGQSGAEPSERSQNKRGTCRGKGWRGPAARAWVTPRRVGLARKVGGMGEGREYGMREGKKRRTVRERGESKKRDEMIGSTG